MLRQFSSSVCVPSFSTAIAKSAIVKGKTAPLFMFRSIVNAADIIAWAKSQGFRSITSPKQMHVTIAYSKAPVRWFALGESYSGDKDGKVTVNAGGPRAVERFDGGAIVLSFASNDLLWRHQCAIDCGATWDYAEYQPHITLTYDGADMDLSKVAPYTGKIVMGPEMFEDLDDDADDPVDPDSTDYDETDMTLPYTGGESEVSMAVTKIQKVDDGLGIVFGWAIVSEVDGEPYYDQNVDPNGEFVGEHIPQATMMKAAAQFAKAERPGNDMHAGPDQGQFLFLFPLTDDIAKAMNIECDKRGLMVGYKAPPKILKKFKDGDYTGFSIEGSRISFTEHD